MIALGVIVTFSCVVQTAEIANPPSAIVDELDEWVDIGATLAAPNQGLVLKVGGRYRLPRGQLSKRLDKKSQRDRKVFREGVGVWDSICSDT